MKFTSSLSWREKVHVMNFFIKPSEQIEVYFVFAMARKGAFNDPFERKTGLKPATPSLEG